MLKYAMSFSLCTHIQINSRGGPERESLSAPTTLPIAIGPEGFIPVGILTPMPHNSRAGSDRVDKSIPSREELVTLHTTIGSLIDLLRTVPAMEARLGEEPEIRIGEFHAVSDLLSNSSLALDIADPTRTGQASDNPSLMLAIASPAPEVMHLSFSTNAVGSQQAHLQPRPSSLLNTGFLSSNGRRYPDTYFFLSLEPSEVSLMTHHAAATLQKWMEVISKP